MTFNEKLQWLKLNDRKPEYTEMVDKFMAKKYVASIIAISQILLLGLGVLAVMFMINSTYSPFIYFQY